MKAVGYYIARAFIGILSLLPARVLYFCSDLLYYILYYVVRYRRALVYKNLNESFPEKSEEEIKQIARKFYHHLADIFVEYVILLGANENKIREMMKFVHPEIVNDIFKQNKSVILVAAHYCNWELACYISNIFVDGDETIAVYKRLHNKYWDKWFVKLRSKFGATLVEMRDIYMHLLSNKKQNIKSATALIADQLPKPKEMKYFVNFLNHEGTAVFLGPERIAKKLDMAVVFADMRKISRGKYEIEFVMLVDDAKNTKEHEITDIHVRYLEEKIRKTPEYWMWSHKRWKRTQETMQNK